MWNPFRSVEQEMRERLGEAEGGYIPLADRGPKKIARKLSVFALGICFVILVWHLVALYYNTFMADMLKFPAPAETFERLNEFFTTNYKILGQSIANHTKASLLRWVKGFAVAAVIGLSIGLLMGTSERIHEFAIVPVNVLQLIPGLAWFPVTILLFGLNEKSAIFIIAITIISPIALSTATGLRKVPKVNTRVSQMSGRSRLRPFPRSSSRSPPLTSCPGSGLASQTGGGCSSPRRWSSVSPSGSVTQYRLRPGTPTTPPHSLA